MDVDIRAGEVTVEARPGKVRAEQLVEAVNHAEDTEHHFKARLKSKRSM